MAGSSPRDYLAELAASRGESPLPCPSCGDSVLGKNLGRHLEKVHPGFSGPGSSWTGGDRRIVWPIVGVLILGMGGTAALVELFPDVFRPTLAFTMVFVAGPLFLMAWCLHESPFSARLSVQDAWVELAFTLGVLTHRVAVRGAVVEAGPLVERGQSAGMTSYAASSGFDFPGSEERIGSYLRIIAGRRHVTIGCRESASLRTHFGGLRSGAKRKHWDITLSRAAFVGLHYRLLEVGLLSLPDARPEP